MARLGEARQGTARQGPSGIYTQGRDTMASKKIAMSASIRQIKIRIEGLSALLMHNGQLADPLNHWAKKMRELTVKGAKKTTDDDRAEVSRLEWHGGLYCNDEIGPHLPADLIEAMICEGARNARKGKQFLAAVQCTEPAYALEYEGPRDTDALWDAGNFRDVRRVKLPSGGSVQRTRPIFKKWKCGFTVEIRPGEVSISDVRAALEYAGALRGIGDFRPKFGTFAIDSFEEI